MIRNVILHLHGEQPMKADIEALPTAADAGLLCTNLRTLEDRKPVSTEFLDSVFLDVCFEHRDDHGPILPVVVKNLHRRHIAALMSRASRPLRVGF